MRRIDLDRTWPGTHMHTKTPPKDRLRARLPAGTQASSWGLQFGCPDVGVVVKAVRNKDLSSTWLTEPLQ